MINEIKANYEKRQWSVNQKIRQVRKENTHFKLNVFRPVLVLYLIRIIKFLPNRKGAQTRTDASIVGMVASPYPNMEYTLDVIYIKNPNSIWVNYKNMFDQFDAVTKAVNVKQTKHICRWHNCSKISRVFLSILIFLRNETRPIMIKNCRCQM